MKAHRNTNTDARPTSGGPDNLRTLRKSAAEKSRRDFTILAGGKNAAAVATTGIGLKRQPTPAGVVQPQSGCGTPPGCERWKTISGGIARGGLNHRLGLSHSSGMPTTEFSSPERVAIIQSRVGAGDSSHAPTLGRSPQRPNPEGVEAGNGVAPTSAFPSATWERGTKN